MVFAPERQKARLFGRTFAVANEIADIILKHGFIQNLVKKLAI